MPFPSISLKNVKITYLDGAETRTVLWIRPIEMFFGRNREHRREQWLIVVTNLATNKPTTLCMDRILKWEADPDA